MIALRHVQSLLRRRQISAMPLPASYKIAKSITMSSRRCGCRSRRPPSQLPRRTSAVWPNLCIIRQCCARSSNIFRESFSLCRQYGVRRLDLFGSAARDDFRADASDLYFFIEFVSYDTPDIADRWFGIQEDLQRLFKAPVELVSARSTTNPYFLDVANRSRVSLYAA